MPKKYELLGQKFGKLTVIEKTRKDNHVAWKCQCDCGGEITVITHNLIAGIIVSCGCYRKENAAKNFTKDLTGKQFSELIVLGPTKERKNGAIVWECMCSCGQKTYVQTGNLTSNHTKSCGHLNKINSQSRSQLLGKKFGRLEVVEYLGSDNKSQSIWRCKCDCGNYTTSTSALLNLGHKRSCGCLRSKGEEKIIRLLQEYNIPFETQKSFEGCVFPESHRPALFDFYINNSYIVEYDGIQHYEYNNRGWSNLENLEKTQERDSFKNNWCIQNNIPIIRIPYTHLNKLTISDLLLEETQWQLVEQKLKNG